MNPLNPLSDEAVASLANDLTNERNIMEENEAEQTRRIFLQHAPIAATTICRMAHNATSERLRLQAAQIVIDRALGRVQDTTAPAPDNPLEAFMREITKQFPDATVTDSDETPS